MTQFGRFPTLSGVTFWAVWVLGQVWVPSKCHLGAGSAPDPRAGKKLHQPCQVGGPQSRRDHTDPGEGLAPRHPGRRLGLSWTSASEWEEAQRQAQDPHLRSQHRLRGPHRPPMSPPHPGRVRSRLVPSLALQLWAPEQASASAGLGVLGCGR